jgi:Ca-activated chloride channel family protein
VAAAQQAGLYKIPIYTVAMGTASGTITVPKTSGSGTVTKPVPPDPQLLASISRASHGQTFTAATTERLSAVYDRLGSQLGHRKAKREITAGFAGGGLVLLLAGSLLSLRWFGRLV